MRAWLAHRCSTQLNGTFSRLASSSSEAKALSQITGKTPPTPPDSTTTVAGQAFPGDLRSTSGLGFGDNLLDHTSKWLQVIWPSCNNCQLSIEAYVDDETCTFDLQHAQPGQGGNETSPMEYVWRAEPIKVHGAVVASYGSESHGVWRHHMSKQSLIAVLCLLQVKILRLVALSSTSISKAVPKSIL